MQTTVQTATPSQLLLLLHDAAIRFCKQSIDAIQKKQYSDANRYLQKVQDIISELMITLNKDIPISNQLMSLYDYFQYSITQANMKKEIAPVEEVLEYLEELRQTWAEASKEAVMARKHG